MPVEYQTYTFEDTNSGRAKMDRTIQQMASQGWKVHSKETAQQGYKGGKTCCLAVIFLPLALLGKKNNIITVIFERDTEATPAISEVQAPPQPTKTVHSTPTPKPKTNQPKKPTHNATATKKTSRS